MKASTMNILPAESFFLSFSPQQHRNVFYTMLRIRKTEQGIAKHYGAQEMRCPTHLSLGQEAIAAGVCALLRAEDKVMSAHRSHAHYLAKGGSLKEMIAEMYGKQTGCASGKGGSQHLVNMDCGFLGAVPIVGSTIPIALGVAMRAVMQGKKEVSVAFFGDAATEEGVFHESLNFSALHKTPFLMVCENNFYSVLTPLATRQPPERHIFEIAQAHGVKSWKGNGNKIEEVLNLTSQALDHIRAGNGPAFIEFETYRMVEHCGPMSDENFGDKPPEEIAEWRAQDPIVLYQRFLLNKNIVSQGDIQKMEEKLEEEIEEAIQYGKESPFPEKSALHSFIYKD